MRIKISLIIKWIIGITMISALSLFKPLGALFPVFYFDYAVRWGIVVLAAVSMIFLIYAKKIYNNYLLFIVSFIIFLVVTRLCIDLICGRNVYKELNANSTYFFVLLVFPVYYLLQSRTVSLDRMIDTAVFLTILSYLLRIFISVYYAVFEERIFMPISLESAPEDWFRNGVLRINPPCFSIVIIPFCMYRFYTVKKTGKKLFFVMTMFLAVFYSACIHCSRAALIFQVCEIVFLVFIKEKGSLKQIGIYVISGTLIYFLLKKDIISKIIFMFSRSNEEYWFSNSSRFMTYPYYLKMFLDNFWIGKGFLRGEELYFTFDSITGALSDVGILRSLVQLGCGMLVFYVSFLARSFCTGMKLYRNGNETMRILIWGISLSFLLTGINVDCFFAVYVFSVPFCLAIIEHVRDVSTESRRR